MLTSKVERASVMLRSKGWVAQWLNTSMLVGSQLLIQARSDQCCLEQKLLAEVAIVIGI